MIVFTTLHNDHYQPLADITLEQNKRIYCEKHNYPLVVKKDNWHDIHLGFEKVFLLFDALNQYTDCEWVFFSECDTLITNMNIRLEDIIKNEEKHFVITTDCNGINAGNFFVRNSDEGKQFLHSMVNSINRFSNEQDFFKDSYFGSKQHQHLMSIYPQKSFNSYNYKCELYVGFPEHPLMVKELDMFGNYGNWEEGDFLIHLPAISLENRINIVKSYLPKVIY